MAAANSVIIGGLAKTKEEIIINLIKSMDSDEIIAMDLEKVIASVMEIMTKEIKNNYKDLKSIYKLCKVISSRTKVVILQTERNLDKIEKSFKSINEKHALHPDIYPSMEKEDKYVKEIRAALASTQLLSEDPEGGVLD